MKEILLFAGEDNNMLKTIREVLREEDYEILIAKSYTETRELMEKNRAFIVLSDYMVQDMSGVELLKETKKRWPEAIRIVLAYHADIHMLTDAVNSGVIQRLIAKPWDVKEFKLAIRFALNQHSLVRENNKLKEITKKHKIKNYSTLFSDNRGNMGGILIKANIVKSKDFDTAIKGKKRGEFITDALVRLNTTSYGQIIDAMVAYLGIDYIDLKKIDPDPEVIRLLPADICKKYRFIPVKLEGKNISVAMADPSDILNCDNIAFITGFKVTPLIANSSDILQQLEKTHGKNGILDEISTPMAFENLTDIEAFSKMETSDEIDISIDEDEEQEVNLKELVGSTEVPTIIKIVNAIISEAIKSKASDIHIEPKSKYTLVRYRIDGILHHRIKIPADLHPATISRIKIISKLDISERRRPQDGRITVKTGLKIIDLRVSIMPTINGEKVVMRILDKKAAIKKLSELGILQHDLKKINTLIKKPQGIILSSGPTGSGKTTMLYSILNEMLSDTKNFETIEDPVEYFLEDATQVHVYEKIGLSFASVLRATLRQDPDVVLIGEIRDHETADVAFKAALTGHIVLSTLHTNNSVASITRLLDMGIRSYLVASALEGVLAQRLMRKICSYCKTESTPDKNMITLLRLPGDFQEETVYSGKGCQHCNHTGYLGRIGVFELFVMNDDFRHLISSSYKESELINMARQNGMKTLIEDGMEKVKQGKTTLEELLRVLGAQTAYERECESCNKMVDAKFTFCPFCGSFKRNFCKKCMISLKEDWKHCPSCGTAKNQITPPG